MTAAGKKAEIAAAVAVVLLAGCSTSYRDEPAASEPPSPTVESTTLPRSTSAPTAASPTSPTPLATATATNRTGPRAPLIVIDPGHSGRTIRSIDKQTGLRDIDYPNYPEIYEVFDVSYCVARALRADGYRVTLTKKRALDSVGLARRARIANEAHADLAISVHDDHGQGPDFQATYDQRGLKDGAGRYRDMYRGSGVRRTVFERSAVAKESQRSAKIIAEARTKAQGRRVTVRENSFTGRAPLEPGNLALVQLFSTVPWVYNELGAASGGSPRTAISIDAEHRYAKGLLLGIEAARPLEPRMVRQPSRGARLLRSCLIERVEPAPGNFIRPRGYLPQGYPGG